MLKDVINDIAKGLKIEVPQPDDDGEYTLVFDDNLEVYLFSLKQNSLILTSVISEELPNTTETENFLKKILQINFIRLKDHEEVLTWDPDFSLIILSKEIPFSNLSEKPILEHLEKFLNSLEFWQSTISQGANSPITHLPQ